MLVFRIQEGSIYIYICMSFLITLQAACLEVIIDVVVAVRIMGFRGGGSDRGVHHLAELTRKGLGLLGGVPKP